MCILSGEIYSEKNLRNKGSMEDNSINAIVKAMTVYSDATFLGNIIIGSGGLPGHC